MLFVSCDQDRLRGSSLSHIVREMKHRVHFVLLALITSFPTSHTNWNRWSRGENQVPVMSLKQSSGDSSFTTSLPRRYGQPQDKRVKKCRFDSILSLKCEFVRPYPYHYTHAVLELPLKTSCILRPLIRIRIESDQHLVIGFKPC